MNPFRRHVLMEGTPGATGGADDAATAAAQAAAAAGGTPPTDPPAAPSALAKPVPLHERIPEKFHVKNGEALDPDASWGKVLEGYKALEQRVGSGDLPPKAAEEYTITPPEALKDTWKEDEKTAAFRKDALANGLTQKQFDFVMGKYFSTAGELMQAGVQNSVEATVASLDKAWGAEYDKNLEAASKAFAAYADPADKGRFDDIMRDPSLAYRILAKIGPELAEAGGVPRDAGGAGGGDDVQALLTHPAAGDPKHPEHKAVRAKLDTYYARKYGNTPVT